MKKISFCLFLMAGIIISCQKDNSIDNKNTNTTEVASQRASEDRFKYYHNGIEITDTEFTAVRENTHNIINIEGVVENPEIRIFNVHAFDTKEQYITFGNTLGLRLDKGIEAAEHLHQYALDNGVIAHYEATGEILPSYITYEQVYMRNLLAGLGNKSSSRAVSLLYKSCSSSGLPIPFGVGNAAMPFMPWGWNNEVSLITSLNLIGGYMNLYDRTFFRTHLTTLASGNPLFSNPTVCLTTLPPALQYLDNALSSGINLTL